MKVLVSRSHSPFINLAAEEYLFKKQKGDFLLFYVNEHSVIVGANQALRNEVDLDFCRKNKIQIARRISGGGAVFHDIGNLNYCFITDKNPERPAMDTDFLKPVMEVLSKFNIKSQIGKRKDLWLSTGYKISGTASHIAKNRILFHGTLLYDSNLDFLANALTVTEKDESLKGIASVPSPVKNIKMFLAQTDNLVMNKESFFEDFKKSMADYFTVQLGYFNAADEFEIKKIAVNKYLKEEWIFRK